VSVPVAIGVGSNLASEWGGRRSTIEHAIECLGELEGVTLRACSELVETDPVGGPEQGTFLNGAVLLEVADDVEPEVLLDELHRIERAHGRVRPDPVRWGPRTLDLDLLMMGELVRTEGAPLLPHPRMHERAFVLEPLASIAPTLRHPVLQSTMEQLRSRLATA
jgi:2-amino-4-hydroxy-6-hydroxymethyldihydropteridine diphosphokinase